MPLICFVHHVYFGGFAVVFFAVFWVAGLPVTGYGSRVKYSFRHANCKCIGLLCGIGPRMYIEGLHYQRNADVT